MDNSNLVNNVEIQSNNDGQGHKVTKHNNRKNFKNDHRDDRSQSSIDIQSPVNVQVTSVFKSSTGQPPYTQNSYKYPVNHYEVVLGVNPELTSASDLVSEMSDKCVGIGGHQFHQKVVAAADEARANYLVTQGVGTSTELIQAFYDVLLNSRTIYGLLVAAHRCQNMLNTIDEDQVYLNYLFSSRATKLAAMGSPYLEVNTTTYGNKVNRQNMCFSSAINNADWESLWSSAATCMYLPDQWKKQLECLFSTVFAGLPQKNSQSPTFVVLWPSAFITNSTTALKSDVLYMSNYYSQTTHAGSGVNFFFGGANASISHLTQFVNAFTARVSYLMGHFPELKKMFTYLGIKNNVPYCYTRDLKAATIKVNFTSKIADLIYNASRGFTYETGSSGGDYGTIWSARPVPRSFEDVYINTDPVFKIQEITELRNMKLGSNFIYNDEVAPVDNLSLTLILHSALFPLSFKVCRRYNGDSYFRSYMLARWDHDHDVQAFANIFAVDNTFDPQLFDEALSSYSAFNDTMSYVLPRPGVQIQSTRNWDVNTIADAKYGIIRYMNQPQYYLRDYYLPNINAKQQCFHALDSLCKPVE